MTDQEIIEAFAGLVRKCMAESTTADMAHNLQKLHERLAQAVHAHVEPKPARASIEE